MQRFVPIALTVAVLAAGAALTPTSAQAQTGYNRNQQTTTGDPWRNENDYDYNRQHMTPPNNYSYQNGDDRNYDRNYERYRTQRRPNDYGQYRGYDQRGYDPRADQGYQRPYGNQQGYSRYRSDNDNEE